MSRALVDIESSVSEDERSDSETQPQRRFTLFFAGSFLLGCLAGALVVAAVLRLIPSTKSAETGGEAERSLVMDELVPAISSSAGLPRLDPPNGTYMDARVVDLENAGTLPVVKKVNVGQLPYGHPSSTTDYPKYDGFTLWLAEEFDEPLDLDTDPIWTYSDGGLTEGQVRFVKQAISFKDGKMIIEASNRGLHQGQACSHAEVGYVGHKRLTSGEFRSRYNMFRYGRYEVRMKAPSVQKGNTHIDGNFISTMFVYRDAKFNHWREIDFEITGDRPNAVTANVLKADHTSTWNGGIQSSSHMFPKGLNVRADYHTYAFEWLPNQITWFIDGQVQRVHRGGRVAVPDMSAKIMMNLWVFGGGGFGGSQIHNNQYPMHNEYDWFRFYKWDGDKQYPCLAMDKSCLTQDDQYLAGNNPCDGIPQLGKVHGRSACLATCKTSYIV